MKIYIKNMVCQGTKKYVLLEVKKLGLNLKSFESAELEFQNDLSPTQQAALEFRLAKYGLKTLPGDPASAYRANQVAAVAL